jgi:protocadherin Fat 1/2/3
MPLNIRITSYQDSFPGGQIGRVKATDQDPYDKLEYSLPDNTRLFELDRDNGTLFAYAGLDDGEYLLNVTVTDGKFSAVTQAVISVGLVTDDLLDRSLMVTLGPVKPEDFVMTFQKNFERGVRSLLNVRRKDVRIISIQPARAAGSRPKRSLDVEDYIEVLFAVLKVHINHLSYRRSL